MLRRAWHAATPGRRRQRRYVKHLCIGIAFAQLRAYPTC